MQFREYVFTGGAEVAKCTITDNNVTLCVLGAISEAGNGKRMITLK